MVALLIAATFSIITIINVNPENLGNMKIYLIIGLVFLFLLGLAIVGRIFTNLYGQENKIARELIRKESMQMQGVYIQTDFQTFKLNVNDTFSIGEERFTFPDKSSADLGVLISKIANANEGTRLTISSIRDQEFLTSTVKIIFKQNIEP